MFREMRRNKQQINVDKCKMILSKSLRGALSVNGDDGYPYVLPINFYFDEKENAIYLHGAKEGHKIDAIKNDNKVSFTTLQNISKEDGAWIVESVIVFGKVIFVEDIKEIEKALWDIGIKYHSDEEYVKDEIKRTIDRVQILKIEIDYMSGKNVKES